MKTEEQKEVKVFLAFIQSGGIKAIICQATGKEKMKEAGLNMKLDWLEHKSIESAKLEVEFRKAEIKEIINL